MQKDEPIRQVQKIKESFSEFQNLKSFLVLIDNDSNASLHVTTYFKYKKPVDPLKIHSLNKIWKQKCRRLKIIKNGSVFCNICTTLNKSISSCTSESKCNDKLLLFENYAVCIAVS